MRSTEEETGRGGRRRHLSLPLEEYRGKVYGRLTVLDAYMDKKRTMFSLQCECGCTFHDLASKVASGNKRSCGCLQKDTSANNGRNSAKKQGEEKDAVWDTLTEEQLQDIKVRFVHSPETVEDIAFSYGITATWIRNYLYKAHGLKRSRYVVSSRCSATKALIRIFGGKRKPTRKEPKPVEKVKVLSVQEQMEQVERQYEKCTSFEELIRLSREMTRLSIKLKASEHCSGYEPRVHFATSHVI